MCGGGLQCMYLGVNMHVCWGKVGEIMVGVHFQNGGSSGRDTEEGMFERKYI